MKVQLAHQRVREQESHPSRGAWIERRMSHTSLATNQGRTPHGVRGLKDLNTHLPDDFAPVAPLTGCVD